MRIRESRSFDSANHDCNGRVQDVSHPNKITRLGILSSNNDKKNA